MSAIAAATAPQVLASPVQQRATAYTPAGYQSGRQLTAQQIASLAWTDGAYRSGDTPDYIAVTEAVLAPAAGENAIQLDARGYVIARPFSWPTFNRRTFRGAGIGATIIRQMEASPAGVGSHFDFSTGCAYSRFEGFELAYGPGITGQAAMMRLSGGTVQSNKFEDVMFQGLSGGPVGGSMVQYGLWIEGPMGSESRIVGCQSQWVNYLACGQSQNGMNTWMRECQCSTGGMFLGIGAAVHITGGSIENVPVPVNGQTQYAVHLRMSQNNVSSVHGLRAEGGWAVFGEAGHQVGVRDCEFQSGVPEWLPGHTYAPGTLVIGNLGTGKEDGRIWAAQAGGVSGATEPAWSSQYWQGNKQTPLNPLTSAAAGWWAPRNVTIKDGTVTWALYALDTFVSIQSGVISNCIIGNGRISGLGSVTVERCSMSMVDYINPLQLTSAGVPVEGSPVSYRDNMVYLGGGPNNAKISYKPVGGFAPLPVMQAGT